jgi:hypothetical protein
MPDDEPVQHYSLSQVSGPARQPSPDWPAATIGIPALIIAHESIDPRANPLPDHVGMLTNFAWLDRKLPGTGEVAGAGQNLPVLRRIGPIRTGLGELGNLSPSLNQSLPGVPEIGQNSLPALGELPSELPGAGGPLPGLPTFGGGELPDFAGVAAGLGGPGLPQLPAAGAGLPSLAGVTSPEMPLAPGLGEANQTAGGALAAGQRAIATITGAEPTAAEGPAAAPIPSLDKLTEHIWKQVQHKLKVERERSRGLA